MFQSSAIAKTVACGLLAAYSFVPLGRPTCTGPNCTGGQCARRATVVVNAVPVVAAPQLFNAELGDRWVLVEEPVAEVGEDFESPIKGELEAQAEEADAQEEPAATTEAEEPAPKSDPKAKAAVVDRDATKTAGSGKTRKVWMRASDAAAAGLTPTTSAAGVRSFGSSGSGVALAAPVAYQQVSYQRSYGCTGSGMQAFYGQPVYYQHNTACDGGGCAAGGYYPSATYRTRRVIFPNLFPWIRGLR